MLSENVAETFYIIFSFETLILYRLGRYSTTGQGTYDWHAVLATLMQARDFHKKLDNIKFLSI